MAQLVIGSMKLNCSVGSSNKDYFVELYRDVDSVSPNSLRMRCEWGGVGKRLTSKEYGIYDRDFAIKHIQSKIDKGYEIINVNRKPFPSGNLNDAFKVIETNNNWQATSTAQPVQKIRAVEVQVTFSADSAFAPVW